jgi:hypothetical protein
MQIVFKLQSESEALILEAFSEKNLKKVKNFTLKKRTSLKRKRGRKLTVEDLFLLR